MGNVFSEIKQAFSALVLSNVYICSFSMGNPVTSILDSFLKTAGMWHEFRSTSKQFAVDLLSYLQVSNPPHHPTANVPAKIKGFQESTHNIKEI